MQALVSGGRKGTGWGPRGCLAPGSVGSWCPAGCVSPVPVITGQRGRECPVTQSPAGRDTPRGWEQGQPPAASTLGYPGFVGQALGGSRSWNLSPRAPHGDHQPRAAPRHAAPLPTRLHPGLCRQHWGCGVPLGSSPRSTCSTWGCVCAGCQRAHPRPVRRLSRGARWCSGPCPTVPSAASTRGAAGRAGAASPRGAAVLLAVQGLVHVNCLLPVARRLTHRGSPSRLAHRFLLPMRPAG